MPVDVSKPIECICDACGAQAHGRVFMGIAISPPAGWFVHGRVALDHIVGAVEQWFYCSEKCARKIDAATEALGEIADHIDAHDAR